MNLDYRFFAALTGCHDWVANATLPTGLFSNTNTCLKETTTGSHRIQGAYAMKYLSCVAIVLVAMVGTVRADHSSISTTFEQITADSGHFESAFVEHIPAGYTSWALMVNTTDAFVDTDNTVVPPTMVTRAASWLSTQVLITLTEGDFYYHPTLGAGPGPPPNASLFFVPGFESSRFATYVSSVTPDPGAQAPSGQRLLPTAILKDDDPNTPDEQENIICCGLSPQRGPTIFGMVFGGEASGTNAPGHNQIGIFTISNDAQGVVLSGISSDEASGEVPTGTSPHVVTFDDWFVEDGAFAVPEPSSALLAVIGMIGLGAVRRRRKR